MSSEKRKWFDSRKDLEIRYLPTRLTSASRVLEKEGVDFLNAVNKLCKQRRIKLGTQDLFQQLVRMHPAHRLSRNLSSLLTALGRRPVENVIHDGLSKWELDSLVDLERLGVSAKFKAVAQGLLNVYERYQMLETVRPIYEEERRRKWNIEERLE